MVFGIIGQGKGRFMVVSILTIVVSVAVHLYHCSSVLSRSRVP